MNNNIFPCLWYNEDAKASAEFYCKVFNGKITADTPVVININLFGQKMMLLNGGPQFEKNASVSFTVICTSEEETQSFWDQLMEGGMALMPLDSYPWSKKYGWVRDQFGVTWQLYFGDTPDNPQRIVPTMMFLHENNGKAQEAMDFYVSIFPNSSIGSILTYEKGGEKNDPPQNVQHADFKINNYTMFCMDSSIDHPFNFNEGISMVVMTDNQAETDLLWDSLTSKGGRESMCGWLKDRFGFSWQIVPKRLLELMNDPDQNKSQKVVQAMMKMQKIIIADLEAAYNS